MALVYECFDADCLFRTEEFAAYKKHLFEVHTEDTPGVNRGEVVARLLAQQGIKEMRSAGRPDDYVEMLQHEEHEGHS